MGFFELKVTYETIENTLNVTYQVKNIDNKYIYFGLGGHPSFNFDYNNGEYEIAFTEKAKNILENNKTKNTKN